MARSTAVNVVASVPAAIRTVIAPITISINGAAPGCAGIVLVLEQGGDASTITGANAATEPLSPAPPPD